MADILTSIDVADVIVAARTRKDFGDLQTLADSIQDIGLLQPIGITPEHVLVFGERRLRAVELLGWKKIPARVVNIDSILLGEYAENELRKDFTPSERVAIGKQIEELLGDRRGGDRRSEWFQSGKFSTLNEGEKSRDIAAERAGFGNARTYEQTKQVVEEGSQALIDAVDAGLAASTAAPLVKLTSAEVLDLIAKGKPEVRRMSKEAQQKESASRRQERMAQRAKAVTQNHPLAGKRYVLYRGDLLEQSSHMAAESIDAIITDPPYPEEFLPVYGKLWQLACRILRPGGHCLVMVGQSWLPQILTPFCSDDLTPLTYQWTLAYLTPGQSTQVFGRRVKSNWKPVLWFVKGKNTWEHVGDTVRSDMSDKRFHDWGQSVGGMTQLIERFTVKQSVICDPFCGGGATGVAALECGRFFIGIDIDAACVQETAGRLASLQEAA